MPDKTQPVIIIGGGAWGLSTALHLTRDGYTDITVFERAEEIPSPYSAAYDLNKIVRAEYEDLFYTNLALDAIAEWKTPLWGPYFHQTGYIVCASGQAPQKALTHLNEARNKIQSLPTFANEITPLASRDDFLTHAWQFNTGPLTGFRGYHNRLAGYAHSGATLHGIWQHCARLGVRFVLGERAGRVAQLLYSGSRVTGIRTADGKTHDAATTICALGAHAASLIPALGRFAAARCWSVAHVQLTKRECDYLRGIPTTNIRDLGFFFEPDPETRLFKLCPLGVGYTNPDASKQGISLPPGDVLPPPQDFIPAEDERKLRRLLQEVFPWMADRPFVEQKLCWFSDTKDSEYCIDFVPGTEKSLVVLSGDSGHGFKMMPVFGKWVVDLLSKGEQGLERWQWRDVPEGAEGGWGEAVSWRIGKERKLVELIEEKEKLIRAKL